LFFSRDLITDYGLDPENGDRDKVQEVGDERLSERIKSLKASHPF